MLVDDKTSLMAKIELALEKIRPYLKEDFGDVEVVNVTDEMIVQIKWLGNCKSCKMSDMTLKAGVESVIKNEIPEIKGVEAITEDK